MQFTALRPAVIGLALCLGLPEIASAQSEPSEPFGIKVVDAQTGRGVPLVELKTTNGLRFFTDSAGFVAVDEPGWEGRKVFFHISSHGYTFPADGLGQRGRAFTIEPGKLVTVQIQRDNIAERLYRITGEGIYRDSVLLGKDTPLEKPLLNAAVTGQDSTQAAVYRGKIYWFWGDTRRLRYPLGVFQMTGATSPLPEEGGLDPSQGINLQYFVNQRGEARPMAPIVDRSAVLVWLNGLMVVPDQQGRERLLAKYSKRKSLAKELGKGLVVFNDDAEKFEQLETFSMDEPWRYPQGPTIKMTDPETDEEYVLFCQPFPIVRVPAQLSAVRDPSQYEAWTCLQPGADFNAEESELERDDQGTLVWGWKRNTHPIGPKQEKELLEAGTLQPGEARFQLRDRETKEPVRIHRGSVRWNDFRDRWILIGNQKGGTSLLGEVWYAEAQSPTGPWQRARKIITHDEYSFYNPVHHAFFDQQGGRYIYLEGTYSHTFSETEVPTPRYNYNQILYRLDLSDSRLHP